MDNSKQRELQPAEAEGHEVALTNLEHQESSRESKSFWIRPLLLREQRSVHRQSWLLTCPVWLVLVVLLIVSTVALSLMMFPRTRDGFTVQQVVTLDSNNTTKPLFVAGDVIHYGVYVKHWGSTTLTATLTFVATGPRQIFSWSGPVAPGRANFYLPSTVPPDAPSGTYTLIVTVNYNGVRSAQSSQFQVAGSLNVPYWSQWQGQTSQELDCGPTSVAMLLHYSHHSPRGTITDQLTQIRDIIEAQFPDGNHMDGTNAQELEYSLSYYGKSSSEISLILTPSTATQVMEQMIAQGQPIIAIIDGTVLERPYGGHWVVVTGFSFDGKDDYVHVNDPDSNSSGGNPGHPIVLKLSDFQKAGQSGTIKKWQPYGIILVNAYGIITPSTALNQITQRVTSLLVGHQPPTEGSSFSLLYTTMDLAILLLYTIIDLAILLLSALQMWLLLKVLWWGKRGEPLKRDPGSALAHTLLAVVWEIIVSLLLVIGLPFLFNTSWPVMLLNQPDITSWLVGMMLLSVGTGITQTLLAILACRKRQDQRRPVMQARRLAEAVVVPPHVRAKAAGKFAILQGDIDQTQALVQESLVLCQACGDTHGTARSIHRLEWVASASRSATS